MNPGAPDQSFEVVGVDGCRGGWVAVCLHHGRFAAARFVVRFADLVGAFPRAAVIAVDMPIGFVQGGARRADEEARRFLGFAGRSVFLMPAASVMQASSYKEARQKHPSLSAQAFNLRDKIAEVAAVARLDPRIHEAHPEVSFRALAGAALPYGKKSWNGLHLRRALLASAGIHLPDQMAGVEGAGADDVVDAAIMAWTALRIGRREAARLPVEDQTADGKLIAIWY